MKHCLTLVASAMFFAVSAQTSELLKFYPSLPRSAEIGIEKKYTLVRDGEILFDLVVPSEASPSAKFAGAEAASLLKRAIGTEPSILTARRPGRFAVVIGDTALALKLGVDPAKFDRDGFILRTFDDGILIIGHDDPEHDPRKAVMSSGDKRECATLFGVYDFLERFAGMRFYFPGEVGTVVPSLRNWSLPSINLYDRPDFLQRRFGDKNHSEYLPGRPGMIWPADLDWKRDRPVNRLRLRWETILIPCCHGITTLEMIPRFGKTHPEYFALMENGKRANDGNDPNNMLRYGQFCFSNPGVHRELIADAEAFLLRRPPESRGLKHWNYWWHPLGMPVFDVMPPDGMLRCRCPECQKLFAKKPQEISNYFWEFFSEIALAMKKKHIPGYVSNMAYDCCHMVPEQALPDNLIVMQAFLGPWQERSGSLRESDLAILRKWSEKVERRTWLWTYPGKYNGDYPGIPSSTPRAIGSYLRAVAPYVFGCYIETDCDYFIFNYLNCYVFSRMAWNTSGDPEMILNECYKSMYGAAASEMKKFFNEIENLWMDRVIRVIDSPLGPQTIKVSDVELFEKIYSPAKITEFDSLFNRAEKLAAEDPASLKRIRYMRKEFFGPLKRKAASFSDEFRAIRNWTLPIASLGTDRIDVDGVLNDAVWQRTEFRDLSPMDNLYSELRTRVAGAEDTENLYFAFDCVEPKTDSLSITDLPDDSQGLSRNSTVELFLTDPANPKSYFQFLITPKGRKIDLHCIAGKENFSWNCPAEIRTSIVPGCGWSMEIRIPKKTLGIEKTSGLRANFCRNRALNGVRVNTPHYSWSPFARTFNDQEKFGMLVTQDTETPSLVFNGNFSEKCLGAWTGSPTLKVQSAYYISGGQAIELRTGYGGCLQKINGLKPDTRYCFSYFYRLRNVKSYPGYAGGLFAAVRTDGVFQYYPSIPLNGDCGWRYAEFEFKTGSHPVPEKGISPELWFAVDKADGTAFVDCVRLEEVSNK